MPEKCERRSVPRPPGGDEDGRVDDDEHVSLVSPAILLRKLELTAPARSQGIGEGATGTKREARRSSAPPSRPFQREEGEHGDPEPLRGRERPQHPPRVPA